MSGGGGLFILDCCSCFVSQGLRDFRESMIFASVFFCFLHHLFLTCSTSYEITIHSDIPTPQYLRHLDLP